ncbi:MAG: DMT family transporter [Phycisphaerae bacterium]
MRASHKAHDLRGVVYVTITLLGWSSVLLFLRHLHTYIDGWTANGWRYGMCALVLLPTLFTQNARERLPADLWRRAIPPALLNSAGQVCFGFSIYYIEPGLAGFLLRVALISSTFGAFILFADERVLLRNRVFWGGMSLVVAGSIGTITFDDQPIAGMTATGVFLGAASGAFFGLYGVSVRYWMRGVPSMQSFAAISTCTALVMVGLMLAYGDSQGMKVLQLAPRELSFLILSAFLGIAIGHIAYYASIARLGVAIAGAVVQLAPFLGGAASVVIFHEILTAGQWVSGIIMLIGGALLLRAEQQRRLPIAERPVEPAFPVELEDAGDPSALCAESPEAVGESAIVTEPGTIGPGPPDLEAGP